MAELENYFNKASNYMKTLILVPKCTNNTGMKTAIEQSDGVCLKEQAEGISGEQRVDKGEDDKCNQRDEGLKLSIVETQPEENLSHNAPST